MTNLMASDDTSLELSENDAALILRSDGRIEAVIPGMDDDIAIHNKILIAAIAVCLTNPDDRAKEIVGDIMDRYSEISEAITNKLKEVH